MESTCLATAEFFVFFLELEYEPRAGLQWRAASSNSTEMIEGDIDVMYR